MMVSKPHGDLLNRFQSVFSVYYDFFLKYLNNWFVYLETPYKLYS